MSSVTNNTKVTSSKPYLLRGLYEWILDNNLTPYILVNADAPGTHVPRQYVKEGQITFNISPVSTSHLLVSNSMMEFKAAFGGVPFKVSFPVSAVQAIYARENGLGMFFGDDIPGGNGDDDGDHFAPPQLPTTPKPEEKKTRPSHLKVVK